ncbi:hypothetical protein [Flavobacterium sp.]|uniref:hypothetical protein n=1 Tax=Flavobacterium sp. TaxID=239 RepID=UPI0038FC6A8F
MVTKIKDLIKDNTVQFLEYRKGILWYYIDKPLESGEFFIKKYKFPAPLEDCGDATFPAVDKAIYFMRYINKAIKEGTLANF